MGPKRLFKKSSLLAVTGYLLLQSIILACGSPGKVRAPTGNGNGSGTSFSDSNSQSSSQNPTTQSPPKDYYLGMLERSLKDVDTKGSTLNLAGSSKKTIFLNFDGQTVAKGYGSGQSFLVCSTSATIPAAGIDASSRDAIVTLVQGYYDKVSSGVEVVDNRPSSGSYTTIIIGGTYQALGCSNSSPPLGLAPLDSGDLSPSDIGFVFHAGENTKQTAVNVAHISGHTFGLDSTNNAKDIMYWSPREDADGFLTGARSGGENQDAASVLSRVLSEAGNGSISGGSGSQVPGLVYLPAELINLPGLENLSAMGKVIAGLKPQDVVNIASLSTQIRAILPASISYTGLDKAVTAVALADKAAGGNGTGSSSVGGLSKIFQQVLSNPQTLSTVGGALAVIAGLSGGGGSAGVLAAILQAFGGQQSSGNTSSSTPAQAPNLPDFAGLLGITAVADVGQLLGPYLSGHISVLNGNFGGDTKVALTSMVKVAYAQAFANLMSQTSSGNTPKK